MRLSFREQRIARIECFRIELERSIGVGMINYGGTMCDITRFRAKGSKSRIENMLRKSTIHVGTVFEP